MQILSARPWALLAVVLAPLLHGGCGEKTPSSQQAKSPSAARLEPIRQAAEQGDATAQRKLAQAYYDGQGVSQNYAESAKWYRSAAEQGDAKAQFVLASFLAKGRGVEQDPVEAYMWFKLASLNGYKAADAARTALRRNMSSEELAEGKKLVAQFTAKKSSGGSKQPPRDE